MDVSALLNIILQIPLTETVSARLRSNDTPAARRQVSRGPDWRGIR